ncbi:hypothetical protein [Pedobacter mendelii]|uniref:Uncharacterized protein n=1 Tax=Pedobacter mendelii TaxID=1908240 RepID=A0ABQ2BEN3_9SPHI|nr:hypothetical protein [Pedobacter mendelii]GGI22271.1 hypothetical protein GCM10008119_01810 [Pedobacter mendelii]
MKKIFIIFFFTVAAAPVIAQTYMSRVSKDSVSILSTRVEVLKAGIKLLELKINEAKEEEEVEKLRLKLLEANGYAKSSAEQVSNSNNKTISGSSIDLKAMEKLSKKAKISSDDAQKALDRFNKQISRVEDIRTEIQGEERKLGYKKPKIVYDYK